MKVSKPNFFYILHISDIVFGCRMIKRFMSFKSSFSLLSTSRSLPNTAFSQSFGYYLNDTSRLLRQVVDAVLVGRLCTIPKNRTLTSFSLGVPVGRNRL